MGKGGSQDKLKSLCYTFEPCLCFLRPIGHVLMKELRSLNFSTDCIQANSGNAWIWKVPVTVPPPLQPKALSQTQKVQFDHSPPLFQAVNNKYCSEI